MTAPLLPIDHLLPEIVETLRTNASLVIEAPPGAGKTTRVPRALLPLVQGDVLVLEPRRLAARMAARRVAQELGEKLGETVGYQVRFEDVSGPRTRLRFLTEGLLARRLLSDPQLKGVGAVVLDEFHERHLDGDFALALLRRLQKTSRPELKIIVMSATLDAAPIARFLGADEACPILRSEGRLFHLEIAHTPHSPAPLEEQVAAALEKLSVEGLDGDVLVFLPGAAEIRRSARALEKMAARSGILVVPLHGDLSPAEQDRAVSPAMMNGERQRKVILSTNVAESSVTIEGVTAVIDSGLARVASDSPWTGLPVLEVKRISQASATQRAGRAGRTAPGRVTRLYTAEDLHRRPASDAPEIVRRELSHLVLQLRAMKIASLEFLDAPPEALLQAAETLLDRLGFSREAVSRNVAELPLSPRLAKLVMHAAANGAGDQGCAAAAVLSAGERGPSQASDLLTLIDGDWAPETKRTYEQLRRLMGITRERARNMADADEALLQATVAAFPDRVARHRKEGELLLAAGGSARLAGCRYEFLVALDIEERREKGLPIVRLAAGPIAPEWLLDRATERNTLEWNRTANRVEAVSALLYEQLVIEETRAPAKPGEATAKMLEEKAIEAGIERFVDREALAQFEARAQFAGTAVDPLTALRQLCETRTSFAELESADFLALLRPRHLDKSAPERLRLPGGREVKVNYELGKPPWIESRLQDFFGVQETPRINGTPVVVHLLAPNRRPVQVTSDLAGFWERLYPQVRRELSRRYPKHKWPEKP
jgi:ATP-dependent helicase HrpB